MTATSVIFLLFGASVLWGGLAMTLKIALKDRKKGK